jgi:glycolate oxidase iron-sulfur subunit
MQMASDGRTKMTPEWVGHFDKCLGCMACMPACPSGVQYDKLLESTRAQIARQHPRSRIDTWYRRLLFETLPRPDRLRLLRWPMAVYQRSGLQGFLRRSGALAHAPERLRSMDALMPAIAKREATPAFTPAVGPRRKRVGLLLGCVQREFLSPVNAASARVLAAEGHDVVAPPEQPCCGALMTHAGEEARAMEFARRMIDVFERADVEVIAINAAGCGSAMKEYGHLLRDDPAYADRAVAFSAKCRDVSELLTEFEPRAPRHPLPMRVAYHDACHLQHAQGVRAQPRALLAQVPNLEVVEMAEPGMCCGSAGIYNLVEPDTAEELGDRKARAIVPLKPDMIATGNPGCLLQLQAALARAGAPAPVVHTIQILDASINPR